MYTRTTTVNSGPFVMVGKCTYLGEATCVFFGAREWNFMESVDSGSERAVTLDIRVWSVVLNRHPRHIM